MTWLGACPSCTIWYMLCDADGVPTDILQLSEQAVAANDLGGRVSVVHRDAGLLERGHEMRRLGANIVVADFFDSGMLPFHVVLTSPAVRPQHDTMNHEPVDEDLSCCCQIPEAESLSSCMSCESIQTPQSSEATS